MQNKRYTFFHIISNLIVLLTVLFTLSLSLAGCTIEEGDDAADEKSSTEETANDDNTQISECDGQIPTGSVLSSADSSGMVHLSGGSFCMGQSDGDSDEHPHWVTVSSFYISEDEVTASEYKECVDAGGCTYVALTFSHGFETYDESGKENHPINYIYWNDAQDYATWYSQSKGVSARLCTEAEWEYAARAGTTTKWSCGNEESCLDEVAWYVGNNTPEGTKEVKTKKANAWGIYDMHGNVSEWVQDWYSSSYYETVKDGVTNPTGPDSGSDRVLRGGGFPASARYVRSALRSSDLPDARCYCDGFRLCADR